MSVAYIMFQYVENGEEFTAIVCNPSVRTFKHTDGTLQIGVDTGAARARLAAPGYTLADFKRAIDSSVYGGPTAGNAVVTVKNSRSGKE